MLNLFIMFTGKFIWVFFLLALQQYTFLEFVKGNDKIINFGLWTVMTGVITWFFFKSSMFDLYQPMESIIFLYVLMWNLLII